MKNRILGFTLAEVLITIGIIGVIAAITLPVIKHKIEMQVFRNQFLKQYRNIIATLRYVEAENGSEFACYIQYPNFTNIYTECTNFEEKFIKQYKVVKKCKYGSTNCSPIYKTASEVIQNGGICNGTRNTYLDSDKYYSYILYDGSIIYFPDRYTDKWHIFIDINGEKGPNKFGYDVFGLIFFKSSPNKPIRLSDKVYPICEKGGRRIKNVLLNNDTVNNDVFGE